MADIEKRRGYTPRRERERRAYQLFVGGGIAGAVGVVGLVLAIAGVITAFWPIVALIIAVLCLVGFRRITS
jgi:drug/metabolite transporter (DMT)-like permease